MDAVSIRQGRPGDEDALSLLGQATFLESYADFIAGPDILAHCARQHSAAKYADWLHDNRTSIWLAELGPGRSPIGYVVLTVPDLPLADLKAEDVEIKRIYVLHRFQGVGLGRRLMNEAAAYARAQGKRRLLLGVYSGNAPAIAFYERVGYRQVGRRSFQVGTAVYEDFVLGLDLAEKAAGVVTNASR